MRPRRSRPSHPAQRQGAARDRHSARPADLPYGAALSEEVKEKIGCSATWRPGTSSRAGTSNPSTRCPALPCRRAGRARRAEAGLTTRSPTWRNGSASIRRARRASRAEDRVVGKYVDHRDSYKSIIESFTHAAVATAARAHPLVDSETLDDKSAARSSRISAASSCRGFGHREWRARSPRSAGPRARHPFLGICLGLQAAIIEFARHEAGLPGADSTEFNPQSPAPSSA